MMVSEELPYAGAPVLVTGAGGFIGRALVPRLSALGADVFSFSLQPCQVADPMEKYFIGDIRDLPRISEIISQARPRFVFHLAGRKLMGNEPDDFRRGLEENVSGLLNVIEACTQAGSVERLIYMGSCEVYGGEDAPYQESSREAPVSSYSFSKVVGSYLLQTLSRVSDFSAVELRPSVVYGPGQREGMLIPSLITSLLAGKYFPMSNGRQTRDFVFVDDVVDAILAAALVPECRGEVINVCSGEPVGILDLAYMLADMIGAKARDKLGVGELPCRPGEPFSYWGDNQKASSFLGWKPKTSLDSGLAKTIEYYRTRINKGVE